MPSGHHVVGYSIFGMTIIALAGAVAINRSLIVGIEATKARQTQVVQAISAVRQRTQQWPQNDQDPMLNAADRSRLRVANISFRLDQVDERTHRAFYFVHIGERKMRMGVPERM